MQKALENSEKELEKAKEESTRSSAETERLLHLMQMTQEEQNAKERQIRELQESVSGIKIQMLVQYVTNDTILFAVHSKPHKPSWNKPQLHSNKRSVSKFIFLHFLY